MITIIEATTRGDRQHVYFTIDAYGWSDGSVPADLSGEALQAYLEAREDAYRSDIMQKHYPEHTPRQEMGETRLQAWTRFESEHPEIEQEAFVSNHPHGLGKKKQLHGALKALGESVPELKGLVGQIIEAL
jgi:predicted kinase